MSYELNLKNNILLIFPILANISPLLFLILLLINFFLYSTYNSGYILISYILIVASNFILKNVIAKPIYTALGTNYIPLIGIGNRPSGSSRSVFTFNSIINESFGMPSGHSQIAWFMATYIILQIINNWLDNETTTYFKYFIYFRYIWLTILFILVLCSSIYISYSRVYIEKCHTIQQVLIGGIIGIICGFIVYYFQNKIIALL